MKTVYVVGGKVGLRKIGITGNIDRRLYAIGRDVGQEQKVLASFDRPDAEVFLVERLAHTLLAGKRVHGEWFDVSVEEAIEAITTAIAQVEAEGVPVEDIERKYVALPAEMWQAIKDYQREIGAATLAEAVRRLLTDALRAARRKR